MSMKNIKHYFDHIEKSDSYYVVPDSVWNDLDMDHVFETVDYTQTKYGQQYLYENIRNIKNGKLIDARIEIGIGQIKDNTALEAMFSNSLQRLAKNDSYHFVDLFLKPIELNENKQYLHVFLFASTVILAILTFILNILLIPLVLNVWVNFLVHYREKLNSLSYAYRFSELSSLLNTTKTIANVTRKNNLDFGIYPDFKGFNSLLRKTSFFKLDSKLSGEIAASIDGFLDFFKALFLIDVIMIYLIKKEVVSKKSMIKNNFLYVSHIDFIVSNTNLRRACPQVNTPNEGRGFGMQGKGIFHPLIPDGVSNDFEFDANGVLITGANMSGKSTFLRTIGINSILSMSINSFFGKHLILSKTKLYTSISKADSISNQKSLFYAEAELIKSMCDGVLEIGPHLFLIDEIFSGTNSQERLVMASIILKHLVRGQSIVICTTHDLGLTNLVEDFSFFYFTGQEGDVHYKYDYVIRKGILKTTNAVIILKDLGFSKSLIDQMNALLN